MAGTCLIFVTPMKTSALLTSNAQKRLWQKGKKRLNVRGMIIKCIYHDIIEIENQPILSLNKELGTLPYYRIGFRLNSNRCGLFKLYVNPWFFQWKYYVFSLDRFLNENQTGWDIHHPAKLKRPIFVKYIINFEWNWMDWFQFSRQNFL